MGRLDELGRLDDADGRLDELGRLGDADGRLEGPGRLGDADGELLFFFEEEDFLLELLEDFFFDTELELDLLPLGAADDIDDQPSTVKSPRKIIAVLKYAFMTYLRH